MERDQSERENREKETRILNLTRDLDEAHDRIEELDRLRQSQKNELDDLMSSKDDVGKNVSTSDILYMYIYGGVVHVKLVIKYCVT